MDIFTFNYIMNREKKDKYIPYSDEEIASFSWKRFFENLKKKKDDSNSDENESNNN